MIPTDLRRPCHQGEDHWNQCDEWHLMKERLYDAPYQRDSCDTMEGNSQESFWEVYLTSPDPGASENSNGIDGSAIVVRVSERLSNYLRVVMEGLRMQSCSTEDRPLCT